MSDKIKVCNLCKKGINETSYFGVETRVPINTQVYFHWTCWIDPYLKQCESKIKKAREEERNKLLNLFYEFLTHETSKGSYIWNRFERDNPELTKIKKLKGEGKIE